MTPWMGRMPLRRYRMIGGLVGGVCALALAAAAPAGAATWLQAGQDGANTRSQPSETAITVANAGTLAPRWTFTTGGDISATPAVDGTMVYVPDWAGNLFAVDKRSGTQAWSRKIADYTGVGGDVARTTPAVAGNRLIFGDQGGRVFAGARVMAVSKQTGERLWVTKVDDHFSAIVTTSVGMSPDNKVAYVGVASFEEALSAFIPNYVCCSFRGSVLALDANTGAILWKTYIVPPGFSGGAVWGSTPVIDAKRGSLFFGTGNNYSVTPEVAQCVTDAAGDPEQSKACNPPNNYFDSVMSLDAKTGAVKWASFALPFDAWNLTCVEGFGDPANCPEPSGPDYDFGQGPSLFTVGAKSNRHDVLGIGQKSGKYWTFDPDTGQTLWVTDVGPGGLTGGLQWGAATDGQRIYAQDSNSLHVPWQLVQNGVPTGPTVPSGFWSALDPATGKILWQTPNPSGGETPGAVSVANGVVFGCSLDVQGHMYALSAATGAVLKDFVSGGACAAGASIADGTVFWGSGYAAAFGLTPNDKLYALSPQP